MKTIGKRQARAILAAIFKGNKEFLVCEYVADTDTLLLYNDRMEVKEEIRHYRTYLQTQSFVHPEDREKLLALYRGQGEGQAEIRLRKGQNGKKLVRKLVHVLPAEEGAGRRTFLVRDITQEKKREKLLAEQAARDPLTQLLRDTAGQRMVDEYLKDKDPYRTCGLIVLDIDYFKYVNDTFGHLFGDRVLVELAGLLRELFGEKEILIRFGGDEFVIFFKDVSHAVLVQRSMQLIDAIRGLKFPDVGYAMTCSAGVCYLPENESGYTYNQLFGNADWALYRAKENGKDQYVFCDHLRRFEQSQGGLPASGAIDARYLRNDIISTAFEVFEKSSSFPLAMGQLLEIIGYRFRLDRITVIRTDIQEKNTGRQYQWTSAYAPEVLQEQASFTKEDFVTLFHSYDEYQTTVLQWDNMAMYSPQGAALLMQGGAKTVLYAAMYCEGKYTGAISYVTCREKRYWSRQNRKELGEVTKIISAHLARTLAVNGSQSPRLDVMEYDRLTGLLAFPRFQVELERLVIGNYAVADYLLYMDFVGFKYFNQKYGYSQGDQLLKEFCSYVIRALGKTEGVYFTRVVSDQFLLLLPGKGRGNILEELNALCEGFSGFEAQRLQGYRPRIRVGAYRIERDCVGASFAIDAANYARLQLAGKPEAGSVCLYDQDVAKKHQLENAIINELGEAFREQQFLVYLQPKFSLDGGEVTGAEALVRWRTRDGKILTPDQFIPLCESTGRIKELDFYVFERVAAFLAKNQRLGRRQVPISVNVSVVHAADGNTAQRYREILERYGVDPQYTEVELTETATVKEYEEAKRLFRQLRQMGIHTALDDFGAGYSLFNAIIDIPVDTMKLDRVLIQTCKASDRGIYFLQQLIRLIQGLGYHVICEGVETQEQAQILREAGCREAQGFLFSKPLPLEAYEAFVYGRQA